MPRRVFRVCRSIYARLDGEGAKRVGGRWNSIGHSVVYMAESVALAVLENLVHMSRQDFPRGYVVMAALIPDRLQMLTDRELRSRYGNLSSETLGDQWIDAVACAVLRVPSAIVPAECNYLLNPKHPDFKEIIVEMPVPFEFDERLFRSD
jgi:RES domain-containing protein